MRLDAFDYLRGSIRFIIGGFGGRWFRRGYPRGLDTELRPIPTRKKLTRSQARSRASGWSGIGIPADDEKLAQILDSLQQSGAVELSVNVVCYEDSGWILGKIADRVSSELRSCGVSVTQAKTVQDGHDVVHHIPFHPVAGRSNSPVESVMVTHLDTKSKLGRVRRLAGVGILPITVSWQTAEMINRGLAENSAEKAVCALLPSFVDQPPRLRVGIFCRLYSDGRKREQLLGDCLRAIGLANFELFVMGSGWDSELSRLRNEGLAVSYAPDFDSTTYLTWLNLIDVVMVTGRDEGAISFLDALAVGKTVIASRIGFHVDYEHELVVYANSPQEFVGALRVELKRRKTAFQLVSGNNWRRYGLELLTLWSRKRESDPLSLP